MLICYKGGGPDPCTFPLSKQLFKPTIKKSAMIPLFATRSFGLAALAFDCSCSEKVVKGSAVSLNKGVVFDGRP